MRITQRGDWSNWSSSYCCHGATTSMTAGHADDAQYKHLAARNLKLAAWYPLHNDETWCLGDQWSACVRY